MKIGVAAAAARTRRNRRKRLGPRNRVSRPQRRPLCIPVRIRHRLRMCRSPRLPGPVWIKPRGPGLPPLYLADDRYHHPRGTPPDLWGSLAPIADHAAVHPRPLAHAEPGPACACPAASVSPQPPRRRDSRRPSRRCCSPILRGRLPTGPVASRHRDRRPNGHVPNLSQRSMSKRPPVLGGGQPRNGDPDAAAGQRPPSPPPAFFG